MNGTKAKKKEGIRKTNNVQVRENNTFPLFLYRLGFGDSKTLHGLVLLLRRLLLVRDRPGFTIDVRVHQHATVEGVAVSVGRIAAPMIDWMIERDTEPKKYSLKEGDHFLAAI